MANPSDPYDLFDLHVLRTERLGPSMVRVTFGVPDGFVSAGRDQRIKLFFPHPHQDEPLLPRDSTPDSWFMDWREMDAAERGIMRTYTVRAQRPGEIDVDFALHEGSTGPAATWAVNAAPGARIATLGPTGPDNGGWDFQPPPDTPVVIAGDLTAVPAIAGSLDSLPAGVQARVWIEVPHDEDRQDLPTKADASITWVAPGELLDTVRAAAFPTESYAWIAGESSQVKALRRHLVNERGLHRRSVTFTGYWRRGASEEDLLAEAFAGGNPATEE